jgi:predicted dehydrogenase
MGQDYPPGYVRWTIKRNMQAALELMKDERLDPTPLITSEIGFDDIADHFAEGPKSDQLATLVRYRPAPSPKPNPINGKTNQPTPVGGIKVGLIGTGNYTGSGLLPHLNKQDRLNVTACCSRDGISAMATARKLPIAKAVSSARHIINDANINAVIITTRHDSHAKLAASAMAAGKHIWLEKPVAINRGDIDLLRNQVASSPTPIIFMVGHNRRYAPMSARLRDVLPKGPKHFRYRVRISALPRDHWLHHPAQGGRTIGEISHFIDLIISLCGAQVSNIGCHWLDRRHGDSIWTLQFADGSVGEISYLHTNRRETKEVLQIEAPGFDARLIDWHKLTINGRTVMRKHFGQNKGQKATINAFARAISTGIADPLMPGIAAEINLMSQILDAADT